jgi:hypothetical protein
MKRRNLITTVAILSLSGALASTALAQQQKSLKEQLAGTWSVTTSRTFGPGAKGIFILDGNDRFAFVLVSAGLPKIASNNRAQSTAEENKAIVGGSVGYYGTYSVDESNKMLITRIEGSTYPNLVGQEQKRTISSLTADELQYTNPQTSVGTRGESAWKRVAPPYALAAQSGAIKDQLVGSWTLVSADTIRPDGSKTQNFGADPKGSIVFDGNGRFAAMLMSSERPNFVANNRAQGTDEENKATVQGSIAYFGTYSVDDADKTIGVRIEGGTFPNWQGQEQKRIISGLTTDELRLINPATSLGGKAEVVWKRASAKHESSR